MRNPSLPSGFLSEAVGRACNCRNISHAHLGQACLTSPPGSNAEILYAKAAEIRRADPVPRKTGLEDGTGFNCGRCRPTFEAAAAAIAPVLAQRIIPIAVSQPGSNQVFSKPSCYTCPQTLAGNCTPSAPLACGG